MEISLYKDFMCVGTSDMSKLRENIQDRLARAGYVTEAGSLVYPRFAVDIGAAVISSGIFTSAKTTHKRSGQYQHKNSQQQHPQPLQVLKSHSTPATENARAAG